MTDGTACQGYHELITAWVDGELADPGEVAALEGHLRGCDGCRVYAEAEAATKSVTALAYARPVGVADLRARVLDRVARGSKRVTWPRWALTVPRLAWTAVLPLLLVALAAAWLMLRPPAPIEAAPLLRAAVADHVECMLGRLPLVTPRDGQEVAQWLRAQLARPVTLPTPGDLMEREPSMRAARLADVQAPQIVFDRQGRMLSLFIMPVRHVTGDLGRRVVRDGREFWVQKIEGYWVVLWRRADLIYCLVSDDEEEDLLAVAVEMMAPMGTALPEQAAVR